MKHFYTFVLALLFSTGIFAQNNDCFLLTASTAVAQTGQIVCLDVSVRDFQSIISTQYSIEWDHSKLKYQNIEFSTNPLHLQLNNFGTAATPIGKLRFSWNDPLVQGVSLPDDQVIFRICLEAIGTTGQNPVVKFSSAPLEFETITGSGHPKPFNQVTGGVVIGGTNNGTGGMKLVENCTSPSGCTAAAGAIDVAVAGGQAPYSYQWTGNFGFAATTEDISNLAPGVYFLTVIDANGSKLKAQFVVSALASQINIFNAGVTAAHCPHDDGAIDLSVTGNAQPLQFTWSSGANTQDINGLAPGDYSVTITDAQGCVAFGQYTVGETSSINLIHQMVTPNCGGTPATGSIGVVAQGGASPYSFEWSTGSTNPFISQLTPGFYTLSVTDANGCFFSKTYEIQDFAAGAWDISLVPKCHPADSTGDLAAIIFDAPGIEAPITYAWSNGAVHVKSAASGGDMFRDTIAGVPSGAYTLTVTDAAGCAKTLTMVLDCVTPPGSGNCFAFELGDAVGIKGDVVCLPVKTKGFETIHSFQFSLAWDTQALDFVEVKNLNLANLNSLINFNTPPSHPGKLLTAWYDPTTNGVTVADGTSIFEACFYLRTDAPGNSTTVEFSDQPIPFEVVQDLQVSQNFVGFAGTISWTQNLPPLKVAACTVRPDCSNDGKATLNLLVDGSGLPYTVSWVQNGQVVNGTQNDLVALEPGLYSLTISDLAGASASGIFNFPQLTTGECVWPGDADNNNVVNHFDALYVGLAYGKSGKQRPGASTDWLGAEADDWQQATAQRAVNFKNIDTDGNGVVTADDTQAILKNWSRVIRPFYDNPESAPFSGGDPSLGARFFIPEDTLTESEEGVLPVRLGELSAMMEDIYGIAFSVDYDPEVFKMGETRFQPTASWLGAPNELLVVQRDFPEKGRMDVAVVRKDGLAIPYGFGQIGSLYIVIEDDIFAGRPQTGGNGQGTWTLIDSLSPAFVQLSRVHAINAKEQVREVAPQQTTLQIRQKESIGTGQPGDLSAALRISPNPVDNLLKINLSGSSIEQIEVLSTAGFSMKKVSGSGGNAGFLDTSDLPAGTYFLKITAEKGLAVRKFSVQR